MRRGNGGGIRRTEDGLIESVNMGADFTSEHEWGIKELAHDFGLDKTATPGIPRRTITRVPRGLILNPEERIIAYEGRYRAGGEPQLGKHSLDELRFFDPLEPRTPDEVVRKNEGDPLFTSAESQGAWSEGDFAVRFRKTEQGTKDVLDLFKAFEDLDIAFLFQNVGNNPFARAGLNLVIVSRLPQEIVDDLAEKDADHDRLLVEAKATGIEAELEAANPKAEGNSWVRGDKPFSWFALKPAWADTIKSTKRGELKTEYPVIFFLNPLHQDRNNAGWYTVEDLKAWIRGEGPIPKQQEAKR